MVHEKTKQQYKKKKIQPKKNKETETKLKSVV